MLEYSKVLKYRKVLARNGLKQQQHCLELRILESFETKGIGNAKNAKQINFLFTEKWQDIQWVYDQFFDLIIIAEKLKSGNTDLKSFFGCIFLGGRWEGVNMLKKISK